MALTPPLDRHADGPSCPGACACPNCLSGAVVGVGGSDVIGHLCYADL